MASSGPAQPGAQALAVASGGGSALMLPPPPRPKRKEVVLEEDEWTASLEAIIERDFFPELPKLESKVAWLQAIRSGDPEQIRKAQLLIAQRRAAAAAGGRPLTGVTPAPGAPLFTPGGTAARALAGDTPYIPGLPPGMPVRAGTGARPATGRGGGGGGGGEVHGEEEEEQGVPVAPPVSLDTFMAVHTSEDNASFQEIMEAVNKRRRIKAAAQLAPQPDPKLLITDGRERTDGYGTTGQQPATLIGWKYEPKNALYYDGANREPVPYSDAELAAQVQGAPKAINHGATRFPRELAPSDSATPSTTTTSSMVGGSGRAAAGRAGATAAAAAGGEPSEGRPAAAAGVAGTRGYDILSTPSFDPGAGGGTPFMTWGDIEGTPMRIEAEDLPPGPLVDGPAFFIKEGTRREQQGQALSSRAAAAIRSRRGAPRGSTQGLVSSTLAAAAAARRQGTGSVAGMAVPRPGSSSARPPTGPGAQKGRPLSEAARRLASSMHRGKPGVGQGDDLGLRASYRGSTPSVGRRPSAAGTPAVSAGSGGAWSAAATPGRGWATPAGAAVTVRGATPSVHATLEEEELRVQALLKARQAEEERVRQLQAAREAAKEAVEAHVQQQREQGQLQVTVGAPAQPPPPPQDAAAAEAQQQQQQQQQEQQGGDSRGGGADLTAGLLNI